MLLPQEISNGAVLWRKGDQPEMACLLLSGLLHATAEDESSCGEGKAKCVDGRPIIVSVTPGMLVVRQNGEVLQSAVN